MNINESLHNATPSWLEFQQISLRKLRQVMWSHDLDSDPKDDLRLDGQCYSFDTYINSQHGTGFYIGYWFPFGVKGPALVCNYGIQNKISYSYVSPTLDIIV